VNKISCISWNSYTRSLLASSDYEGVVQLWDPCAQRALQKYEEHEKRCWTVHFSQVQPHCFASGSDDGHVKLWSVNAARSIADIDVGVNICCVHFAPTDANYLVLGSADHNVHRYDLRNTLQPVNIFVAHSKAVSYVKYMDDAHIISASTDSTLRLWDVNDSQPTTVAGSRRTFTGHVNEKNFVGMSSTDDIIACGSELNALHIYQKDIPRSLIAYDFASNTVRGPMSVAAAAPTATSKADTAEQQKKQTGGDFVSAVCCKKNSNIIIAANSRGVTEILELL